MSRSGYIDDMDDILAHGRWRAQVASAIRGKRGQTFLKDMLAALDAMPEKRLITGTLEVDGEVCALGAVARMRSIDTHGIDLEDGDSAASLFDIARPLALEIMFMNDEAFDEYWCKTPEERFQKMRGWVVSHIRPPVQER